MTSGVTETNLAGASPVGPAVDVSGIPGPLTAEGTFTFTPDSSG